MTNSVNYTFLLSLTIIILGILLRRWGVINNNEGKFLAKLIFRLTLPALILDTVPYVNLNRSLIILPFVSFGYSLFLIIIGFIIFRKKAPTEKGLILMTIIGFNIGNFAYPLIEGIWGKTGLQYIAMFDVGNAFAIFALMYGVGAIYSPKLRNEERPAGATPSHRPELQAAKFSAAKEILKKISTSAPLLCYIISLGINVSNFAIPGFIADLIGIIAAANMPIVLLTLGVFLDIKFDKSNWHLIINVILIRYLMGAIIGIILYTFLPIDQMGKYIILIGLILPLGMGALAFSVEFGYDERVVGVINNITILISFGLMWIILSILT